VSIAGVCVVGKHIAKSYTSYTSYTGQSTGGLVRCSSNMASYTSYTGPSPSVVAAKLLLSSLLLSQSVEWTPFNVATGGRINSSIPRRL
jgi:hypothetical protein